jgi:hypothetical protein
VAWVAGQGFRHVGRTKAAVGWARFPVAVRERSLRLSVWGLADRLALGRVSWRRLVCGHSLSEWLMGLGFFNTEEEREPLRATEKKARYRRKRLGARFEGSAWTLSERPIGRSLLRRWVCVCRSCIGSSAESGLVSAIDVFSIEMLCQSPLMLTHRHRHG